MTIYEAVNALCEKNGIKIHELEQTAGIGNGIVGKWRNAQPTLASLEAVAKAFGIPVSELLKMREE